MESIKKWEPDYSKKIKTTLTTVEGYLENRYGKNWQEEIFLACKSLKTKENIELKRYIYENLEKDGETIAIASIFFLGVTDTEACNLCFKDIVEMKFYPGTFTIDVTGDEPSYGKRKHVPRRIPLTDEQRGFFVKRKKIIEERTGESALNYPVACKGNNYKEKCFPEDIYQKADQIRKCINLREEPLLLLLYDSTTGENPYDEDNPITYMLRATAATRLYVAGVSSPESQYYMGHDILDTRYTPSDFLDEDYLFAIKKKLEENPWKDL